MIELKTTWLSTKFALLSIFATILILLPMKASAQGASIYGQALTSTGKPASYATVRVCAYTGGGIPCTPLSSLFADLALTQPLSNPYTTDFYGNFSVFVESGNAYIVQLNVAAGTTYSYLITAGGVGGGTVSSVGLSAPSSVFTVSGSPVTGGGVLALGLVSQLPNTALMGPTTGGSGTPGFRYLVPADITPAGTLTNNTSGNAATATALQATQQCPTGQAPTGITANGTAQNCTAYAVAGGSVQQLIAGTGVSLSPTGGTGVVTVTNSAPLTSLTTSGSTGSATLSAGTLNVPQYCPSGGCIVSTATGPQAITQISGAPTTIVSATTGQILQTTDNAVNLGNTASPTNVIGYLSPQLGITTGYPMDVYAGGSTTSSACDTPSGMSFHTVNGQGSICIDAATSVTPGTVEIGASVSNTGLIVEASVSDSTDPFMSWTNTGGRSGTHFFDITQASGGGTAHAAFQNMTGLTYNGSQICTVATCSGGITSINGNTTAAQVIAAGTGISVSSSAGTTTITNTGSSTSSLTNNYLANNTATSNFTALCDSICTTIESGIGIQVAANLQAASSSINAVGGSTFVDIIGCTSTCVSSGPGGFPVNLSTGITSKSYSMIEMGYNDLTASTWTGTPANHDQIRGEAMAFGALRAIPSANRPTASGCTLTGTHSSTGGNFPTGTVSFTSAGATATCTLNAGTWAGVIVGKSPSSTATYSVTLTTPTGAYTLNVADPVTGSYTLAQNAGAYESNNYSSFNTLYAVGMPIPESGSMTITYTCVSPGSDACVFVQPLTGVAGGTVSQSAAVVFQTLPYYPGGGSGTSSDTSVAAVSNDELLAANTLRGMGYNVAAVDPNSVAPPTAANKGKVLSITVTAGGSGYTSGAPTFTGCAIAPTINPIPIVSGALTTGSYQVNTAGACVSTPTVSFTGGTGATATASWSEDIHYNYLAGPVIAGLVSSAFNPTSTTADKRTITPSSGNGTSMAATTTVTANGNLILFQISGNEGNGTSQAVAFDCKVAYNDNNSSATVGALDVSGEFYTNGGGGAGQYASWSYSGNTFGAPLGYSNGALAFQVILPITNFGVGTQKVDEQCSFSGGTYNTLILFPQTTAFTNLSFTAVGTGGITSLALLQRVFTANTTLATTDGILLDNASSAVTVTLPLLTSNTGPYFIINGSTSVLTVTGASGTALNYIPFSMPPGQAISVSNYGANWFCDTCAPAALALMQRLFASNTTLLTSDGVLYDDSSSALTLTLPNLSGVNSGPYFIVNSGTNTLTLTGASGTSLNNTPATLAAGQSIIISNYSTNWFCDSCYLPTALPNGTTATTQTVGDNTTKVATDAFVLANAASSSGAEYTVQAANGSGGLLATSIVDNGTVSTTEALTAATFKPSTSRKSTFTCTAAGTITIANTNELATSDVIISLNTAGGTISTPPAMKTATAGTGFTVLCGAADTSVYNYSILN